MCRVLFSSAAESAIMESEMQQGEWRDCYETVGKLMQCFLFHHFLIAEEIFFISSAFYYCLMDIIYLPLSIERFFKITLGHIDKLGDYFLTHEVYIGDIYKDRWF
ncbi:hypothetical protein HNR43_001213 [Anoxybacillus mongoliensis]|uniref:Uncharacterized protein n=1 Tax=Anoxybacillus mongoliensis TaxID=452565 RepID=A0A7W8JGL8_9BACL|nr:hypothetical protein [Anoxybacillus mongoliensis]